VVPTASMVTGAVFGLVWFWIPLSLLIIAVSSIPSVIGFLLAGVVFIYLMRGVDRVERVRSEAVFGFGIPVPPRKLSHHTGFQRWAHQLWLDVSSATFWKAVAHHYLRMIYDILATVVALALLAIAIVEPALAMVISGSDDALGLSFVSPPLAWLLAIIAFVAAVAILVFAPPSTARSTGGSCLRRPRPPCVPGQRLNERGRARSRPPRPNGTASSATCTTASNLVWSRWR
jgi:hypothetical protein